MGRGRPRKIRPREELQLDVRDKGNKAKDTGSSGSGKAKTSVNAELGSVIVPLGRFVPLVLNQVSPLSIGPELAKEGCQSVNGSRREIGEDLVKRKLDLQEQKVETKWATLFTGTRLTNKGMDLSFVAPTVEDGRKVIQLLDTEVEKENEKWRKAVILYVVGESPTIGPLERYITANWNFAAKPKINFHNDG
ncbi:hypothetical protein HAX54_031470 [Datura stramonium]|uniref:DUF4283 domain-containing protein n=1 Tax=Datura stramonium TaxID=4076 RepID=A0ABS8VBP7_DATST|nr:hypothetical protein [Datura stramonium]